MAFFLTAFACVVTFLVDSKTLFVKVDLMRIGKLDYLISTTIAKLNILL